MADETTKQTQTLPELAREAFGIEYHADPRLELPAETGRTGGELSLDAAVAVLAERREQREKQQPATRTEPARREEHQAPAVTDDELQQPAAMWSTEDLQTIMLLQQEAAAFQRDLKVFAHAKALGVDGIAKGDKAKAAAVRAQLQAAEAELRHRHATLQAAVFGLAQKVQQRNAQQRLRHLQKQDAKLTAAFPSLDRTGLRDYLLEEGFTRQEIDSVTDARTVALAEKARRYDDGEVKTKEPPPVPKPGKRTSRSSEPERRGARLSEMLSGRLDNATSGQLHERMVSGDIGAAMEQLRRKRGDRAAAR